MKPNIKKLLMQSILDAINEWIKEILIGAINGNLSTMFGDVNEKVGTIAAEVGQTPQGWNAGIFSMIQSLSENVIVPIAGLVITYVLCVELISMVTEKNNMHDIDTFMFFKWFFKAWVAVYLVTMTVHHSHLNRPITPYSGKHQPEMLYVGLVFKRISVTVLVVDFIVIPCEERFHIVKLGELGAEQLNTGIFCYCLQPPLFQIGQGHGGLM